MDTSHTAPPPAGAAPIGASLRRSTSDRLLLGLCAGIARSVGASPLVIRLATLCLGFLLVPFVLAAYLGTALIVPRDDGTALLGRGGRDTRDVVVVLLSLAVAAPLILGTAGTGVFGGFGAWPAVLLASVVLFVLAVWRPKALFGTHEGDGPAWWQSGAFGGSPAKHAGKTTGASAAGATAAATAAHTVSPGFGDPFHGTVSGPYPDVELSEAETMVRGTTADQAEPPTDVTFVKDAPDPTATFAKASAAPGTDLPRYVPLADEPEPATAAVAPAPRRRSIALPILATLAMIPALFVVLVAVGLVAGGWDAWAVMLALMAVGAAAGAVAIAFVRPSYLGAGFLVILAAILGAGSVALNQFGPVLSDGVGTRIYAPAATSELLPQYVLGAGRMNLDLRDLTLRPGTTTHIRAKLGFGQLRVILPKGVRVVAAPGSDVPDLATTATANGASTKASATAPIIALDVHLRGGEADLLTGNSRYDEDLTVLSSATHGFWGTNDTTSQAVAPQKVTRP